MGPKNVSAGIWLGWAIVHFHDISLPYANAVRADRTIEFDAICIIFVIDNALH